MTLKTLRTTKKFLAIAIVVGFCLAGGLSGCKSTTDQAPDQGASKSAAIEKADESKPAELDEPVAEAESAKKDDTVAENQKATVEATEPEGAETDANSKADASTETVEALEAAETAASVVSGGVTPEFKETMDGYEAFFDEYCEFMQAYNDGSPTAEMIAEYASMMTRYAETTAKVEAIDEGSLSTADYAYYVEVMARVDQKLLTVADSA
ncbi:DUF6591 domain-containing protein [Xiamenia xianingshaonis]|uniref:DUF6591 domain-containing protein n=1 Tax=Xiamenia xianingshaonis TaxID=2682776 RepID=A0A9E6MQK0_9ACTN|nr:DUF6591 domain-containing protein [Xiamenia xianingshaonis]NHM14632.1 hypothetical protein [Xiamenia xianingshaonis]QTU84330.1 hypothetical protein J7S26_08315 [Xiamenia xianingshaonis]